MAGSTRFSIGLLAINSSMPIAILLTGYANEFPCLLEWFGQRAEPKLQIVTWDCQNQSLVVSLCKWKKSQRIDSRLLAVTFEKL